MRGGGIRTLIFLTQTPDHHIPATGHILQERLGFPSDTFCVDVTEGCSGFVTGLYIASLAVMNTGKSALLLGGDTSSKIQSPDDRGTRCIFGDAGYAALISPESGAEDIPFMFNSYGDRAGVIIRDNDGFRIAPNPRNGGCIFMDGAELMKFTLSDVPKVITRFLEEIGTTADKVGLFACHQANKLMLSSLARKLGVNVERLPFVAGDTGNTSSASIPLLLSEYAGKDCLSRVVCAGFGVGLSVGLCEIDFSHTEIFNTIEI